MNLNLKGGEYMKSYFKLFSQIMCIFSIIIFLFILKLWINNDSLLYETRGYVIWVISIAINTIFYLFMKKYKVSSLITKIILCTTILSIGLLIVTGFIFVITSSMP
jgi:hypothetical protein